MAAEVPLSEKLWQKIRAAAAHLAGSFMQRMRQA
jgi:hypothetical protein